MVSGLHGLVAVFSSNATLPIRGRFFNGIVRFIQESPEVRSGGRCLPLSKPNLDGVPRPQKDSNIATGGLSYNGKVLGGSYRGAVLFNSKLSLCDPSRHAWRSGGFELDKVAYVVHSISHGIIHPLRSPVNPTGVQSYKPPEATPGQAAFRSDGRTWPIHLIIQGLAPDTSSPFRLIPRSLCHPRERYPAVGGREALQPGSCRDAAILRAFIRLPGDSGSKREAA